MLGEQPLPAEQLAGSVLLLPHAPDDLDVAGTAAAAAELGARALLIEAGEPSWFYKTIHTGAGRLPVLRLRRSLATHLAAQHDAEAGVELALSQQTLPFRNVVGRLPGSGTGGTLLLSAHYDHIGDDPGGERFPGAFDNASGVAIVLALASTLAALPERLPFNVQFALLTGEESGLHGARHLLAHSRQRIAAAINVDSIGSEAEPLVLRLGHGRRGDWLAERAAEQLSLHAFNLRWIQGRDDARVFQAAGIPTVGLGQQPGGAGRNPMHTPDDRPEQLHLDLRIADRLLVLSGQPGALRLTVEPRQRAIERSEHDVLALEAALLGDVEFRAAFGLPPPTRVGDAIRTDVGIELQRHASPAPERYQC